MAGYLDSGAANRRQPVHPALRDRGMKEACRGCSASAVRIAVHFGASISAVPVALVTPGATTPVALVGGANPNPGEPVVIKALTLQLAAKARRTDRFTQLVSLGARLDEPGTSVASIRALILLVTQGRDAPDLLRLFFPSGPNAPLLARQLSQDLRGEALVALLEGYNSPFSSQAVDEYIGFAGALLDAGANPDICRRARNSPASALSAAVKTLSPDLVRFLLDRGASPNGPRDLYQPPISYMPLHNPLCAVAHALAISLLDMPTLATLRQLAEMLLDRGADINICVPYLTDGPWISFTSPLIVFLDSVACWDDDEGSQYALATLRFLFDLGASLDPPAKHPAFNRGSDASELLDFRYSTLGYPRVDVIRDLLTKWGIDMLASPAFASTLELLVRHPGERGGVRVVAKGLTAYDYTLSSSSPSQPTSNGDAILGAWTRLVSAMAGYLTPHELGEFLHAYVVCMGTCPASRPRGFFNQYHQAASHEIGDLAKATVTVLLAAGADMNHRGSWGSYGDPTRDWMNGGTDRLTPLHGICVWLAGRSQEESRFTSWYPSCHGFRHTPRRTAFIRFLIETCGADRDATYLGRTPAETIVQLRHPKLDEEETGWGRWTTDPAVVEEGRRALLDVLETGSATA